MAESNLNMPLVSICMPAYNAAKYIEEALGSVFNQSYKNIEVVVVNDGSTDDTAAILASLENPALHVYHTENNGQCAAANLAYTKSTGQLIKFMDADDLISANFIENQVKRIGNRDNVIASSDWGRFYNDDINTFKLFENSIKGETKPIEWLVASFQNDSAMMQCARWLIPRAVLERSGLWDESLSLINDFEFFIRVLLHTIEVRFTDDAVLYYRSGLPVSLSALKSRKGFESSFHSTDDGMKHLLAFEDTPRTRQIAANSYQMFIYTAYPHHPDLLALAQKRVDELGGASIKFPAGGITRILYSIIGWKATKRIKTWLN